MLRLRLISGLITLVVSYLAVYSARNWVVDNPEVAPEIRTLVKKILESKRRSHDQGTTSTGHNSSSSKPGQSSVPDLGFDADQLDASLLTGQKKREPARAPSPGPVTIHNDTIKDAPRPTPAAQLPKVISGDASH